MQRAVVVLAGALMLGLGIVGCAAEPSAADDASASPASEPTPSSAQAGADQKEPFALPLSLRLKILSEVDANGLAQLGSVGLTEYVVKPVPGMNSAGYTTFDNSLVVTINGPVLSKDMVTHIRSLIATGVQNAGFKLADPAESQAGIAAILSPFRSRTGNATWELLVVVFDRAKMRAELDKKTDAALATVFQAAVRAMVVHLFPETELRFDSLDDETTREALRKMFDKAFSDFMAPLASEKAQ